jgi:beta-glucosidase
MGTAGPPHDERGGHGMISASSDRFPPGFLWGAATSAYQIEGAVTTKGLGPSIWDTFCARPGAILDGSSGAVAADHYHRSRDDVTLMADLRLQMYRFSVSWSRIQPTGAGPADQRGLDFYRRLVDDLLAHDIVPNLTLYHWDLPQALQETGGWPARDTAYRFADYAELVYRELSDRVGWWSTINEPWCVALLGHAAGIHAPGVSDPRLAVRAIHHTLLGHGLAVMRMRAVDSGPRLAIVLNPTTVRAAADKPDGNLLEAIRVTDGFRNRIWLDPLFRGHYPEDMVGWTDRFGGLPVESGDLEVIGTPIDWLGVNYYNDTLLVADDDIGQVVVHPGVRGVRDAPPSGEHTDLDWPITPDGLRALLVSIAHDYPNAPPMMITENGAAYDDPVRPDGMIDDQRRIRYLRSHIDAVAAAIAEGVAVRGYLVWSFLDNFEWSEGYTQRFGIVHVDYETQARTPRRSAAWYQGLIQRNGEPE